MTAAYSLHGATAGAWRAPRSAWLMLVALLCLSGLSASCGGAAAQRREREAAAKEASAPELIRRGEASASLGDLTRAEQYFVAALKTGGDEKQVTERLLAVCVADQRYPVAVEYAEQYLYRHPRDADVEFAAGSLHAALGNVERARALLADVASQRPNWPEVHYALATVLRDQGEALELADRHDLAYLRLSPQGTFSETVRARLRSTP
jgi:tetratricopeptide (TPR) repeat protein